MGKKDLTQKVWHHAGELVNEKGYAAPIDVLVKMEQLTVKQVEDWRFGRIPYLEKVVQSNLGKMNIILRAIREFGQQFQLKASTTVYHKWGKGRKAVLQFSKSGAPHLEQQYATHYVLVKTEQSHRKKEG